MKASLSLKQEQVTIPDLRMETIICLSNVLSSDSQFIQKGEGRYKEELTHGCYHNLRKPPSD